MNIEQRIDRLGALLVKVAVTVPQLQANVERLVRSGSVPVYNRDIGDLLTPNPDIDVGQEMGPAYFSRSSVNDQRANAIFPLLDPQTQADVRVQEQMLKKVNIPPGIYTGGPGGVSPFLAEQLGTLGYEHPKAGLGTVEALRNFGILHEGTEALAERRPGTFPFFTAGNRHLGALPPLRDLNILHTLSLTPRLSEAQRQVGIEAALRERPIPRNIWRAWTQDPSTGFTGTSEELGHLLRARHRGRGHWDPMTPGAQRGARYPRLGELALQRRPLPTVPMPLPSHGRYAQLEAFRDAFLAIRSGEAAAIGQTLRDPRVAEMLITGRLSRHQVKAVQRMWDAELARRLRTRPLQHLVTEPSMLGSIIAGEAKRVPSLLPALERALRRVRP